MQSLFEILKWVGAFFAVVTGGYTSWKLAASYMDYRNTRKSVENVKAKLHVMGIVAPQAIDEFIMHLVDKGIYVPAGPNGPGKTLTCTKETGRRIVGALTNLMSSESLPTGRAALRGALAICLGFVEEVLQTYNPNRRAGEIVASDDEGWVLERLLGMDVFGEIWLGAKNDAAGLPVANIHGQRAFRFFTDATAIDAISKVRRELDGAMLALGNHPHIVHFYHFGTYLNRFPYLALEYVRGGSLADWIVAKKDQRVPLRKGDIIQGIVSALSKAHEAGIYHCDLRPGRILLTERFEPDGDAAGRVYDVQAKLADFGLTNVTAVDEADRPHENGDGTRLHAQPACKCQSMYLPPEASQPREPAPAQDDVFALGVIWYQLLVERLERPPYDFAERLRDEDVDARAIQLISHCLACPRERYKNAEELENDFGADEGPELPEWPPVPAGLFDVSHLVRDYIAELV